jgi:hypothetical protein
MRYCKYRRAKSPDKSRLKHRSAASLYPELYPSHTGTSDIDPRDDRPAAE